MLKKFIEELDKLGSNDRERAEKLGLSSRSITRYKAGHLPPAIVRLMRYPNLLIALADATSPEEQEEQAVEPINKQEARRQRYIAAIQKARQALREQEEGTE